MPQVPDSLQRRNRRKGCMMTCYGQQMYNKNKGNFLLLNMNIYRHFNNTGEIVEIRWHFPSQGITIKASVEELLSKTRGRKKNDYTK